MHAPRIHHAGLVFLVIVLGMACARPSYGQISPGPLARAHESLGGPLNCAKCHEVGAGRGQEKCLTCHTEIRQRLTERHGMHAVWVAADQAERACAACHSDHNGADFPLVRWRPNRESLDHRQTGYALTGKHVRVACASCHKAANIPAAARGSLQVKDLNRSFLGLSRDCASCHTDEHRGQLGSACTRCHTTDAWKPATGFNHSAAKFTLTGAHATVDCVKCHPAAAGPKTYTYTGINFATCTACHTDPHRGSLAGSCQSCHDTTTWKRVRQLTGFDHSRTAFALDGKHGTVACSACHRRGDFKTKVAHTRCADCHEDAHRRQFAARADRGECAACHTVAGFRPSTFDVKAHTVTAYPLDGRHAAVVCADCHKQKGKDTIFKITNTQCAACHEDIHKGQFTRTAHQNRCEDCHTVQAFAPSVFTLVRHRDTRFPLTGAHVAVTCVECHTTTTGAPARPVNGVLAVVAVSPALHKAAAASAKYVFDDRSCSACHEDPHRGQFRERMTTVKAAGSPAGCEACHETGRWTELARFDHSTSRFPLLGAHRGVACMDCHRPPNFGTATRTVDYRDAPRNCAGCHEDPHGGQFAARKEVSGCESCHSVAQWRPAAFDHDRRTGFALAGAHQRVACSGCHKLTRPQNGNAVLLYAPTPNACEACHA